MATIPSYTSWSDGQVVTAALMNSNINSPGSFFLATRPVGVISKTVTTAITTGTDTALVWDVDYADNDNAHSIVTNTSRYTVVTPGRYSCQVSLLWASNTVGARDVFFRINGTGTTYYRNRINGPGTWQTTGGILPVLLNATDYIEVVVNQTSGMNLACGSTDSYWDVEWLATV